MNIVINDLLVNYQLSGRGELVLLLHGWGDSAKGLAGLGTDLAKEYRVLALDLPGFGASQPPEAVWNLDNYAAFIRDFLVKLNLTPFAVIGHSNGGALAIRAIATGAIRPQKLVLLAASGIRNSQPAKRLALKVVAKTGNAATIWLPKSTRQKLRTKLYGAVGSDMLVVEQLQETFKQTVRQDVQADAAQLKLPTLLIFADQDKAVTLADGRTYHKLIKDSRLEIITGAGLFVHLDEPLKVATLITEFLA